MASLLGKYWYSDAMLTPAFSAIALVVSRAGPCFFRMFFGSLRPADVWDRVPEGRLPERVAAAPSFRPPPSEGVE